MGTFDTEIKMSVLSRLANPKIREFAVWLRQPMRQMGGGPKWDHQLNIRDSQWGARQGFNWGMFWGSVFAVPLLAISAYTALFIGDAKLAPIPEGYEQENYEVNMHGWWELHNDMCRKLLLQEVWRNMKEQGDYANWYYIPYDAGRVRMMNRIREEHYTKTKGSF